jgi:hypothetical protein
VWAEKQTGVGDGSKGNEVRQQQRRLGFVSGQRRSEERGQIRTHDRGATGQRRKHFEGCRLLIKKSKKKNQKKKKTVSANF